MQAKTKKYPIFEVFFLAVLCFVSELQKFSYLWLYLSKIKIKIKKTTKLGPPKSKNPIPKKEPQVINPTKVISADIIISANKKNLRMFFIIFIIAQQKNH